jgi:hypothetical protein
MKYNIEKIKHKIQESLLNKYLEVQTGSRAHPASYPMGNGDSFSGGKAAGP